jgi:hypothetical protein
MDRAILAAAMILTVVGCGVSVSESRRSLTAGDWAYASNPYYWLPDSVKARFAVTPQEDTAYALSQAGAWDIEGGDARRGLRLIAAAIDYGIPDSSYYRIVDIWLQSVNADTMRVRLFRSAAKRWPRTSWPWRKLASIYGRMKRPGDSVSAAQWAAAYER